MFFGGYVPGANLLVLAVMSPPPPPPPIIVAAEHGDVQALAAQLDKGVDPDTKNGRWTALMIAAWRGDREAVRLLLDRHASVDLEDDSHYMTPLMYAAVRGHSDVGRQILESCADVNHANQLGQTALLTAIRPEFMVPLLLDDSTLADSLGRTLWRRTPIEDAAHSRTSAAVVRMLLEHEANVHALDRQGHDALFYASGDCQSEVVKLLKSAGAAGRC